MSVLSFIRNIILRAESVPMEVHKSVIKERDMYKDDLRKIAMSYNMLLEDHEKILATVDVLEAKFRINEEKFNIIYSSSTVIKKDRERIQDLEDQLTKLVFAPHKKTSRHRRIDLDNIFNHAK